MYFLNQLTLVLMTIDSIRDRHTVHDSYVNLVIKNMNIL